MAANENRSLQSFGGQTEEAVVPTMDSQPPEAEGERPAPCSSSGSEHQDKWSLDRLPPEVLLKILFYLDPNSLICISHVNRLFHSLGNDDTIWRHAFMSEFGRSTARWSVSRVLQKQGHWKQRYLWYVAGQEVNLWKKELRHTNPRTGLPLLTRDILRELRVSWELTLSQLRGSLVTQAHSHAHYYESTVVVCWNGPFPNLHHITSLQLHASHRGACTMHRRTGWRSMMLNVDLKSAPFRCLGKDTLIALVHVAPSLILGTWRGNNQVAFIMVCLHHHLLVERSLMGSPAFPYTKRPSPAQNTTWNLRGFTLRLLLHGSHGAEFTSLQFNTLLVCPGAAQLVEVQVVHRWDQSQHQLLTGAMQLAWRVEPLQGAVQNCCFLALTLLDRRRQPCWCVSTPVCLRPLASEPRHWSDYGSEPLVVEHSDRGGRVDLQLVRMPQKGSFLLVGLTIHVPPHALQPKLGK